MKNYICSTIVLILCYSCFAFAQTNIEIQGLHQLLAEAEQAQGDLLFPNTYQDLLDRILDMETDRRPVSQSVQQAAYLRLRSDINQWSASCREVNGFLVNFLTLRSRVTLLKAEEFASESFDDGDRQLRLAAESFLAGDRDKARQLAAKSRLNFLKAESQAIRNNFLGEMRIQLQECRDLKAERFAPKSFRAIQDAFDRLESRIRSQTVSTQETFDASRNIAHSADRLLNMLQTINPLFKDAASSETLLVSIFAPLDQLCAELEFAPDANDDIASILSQLLIAVRTLQGQNERLEARQDSLEGEQRELEAELVELRDVQARQAFLQQKIQNFRSLLKHPIEHIDNRITIRYDSLGFGDAQTTLNPQQQQQLQSLVEALRVIPSAGINLRYETPLIDNNPNFSKDVAGRRVSAIKHFLNGDAIVPREDVNASGHISRDASLEQPRLTIVLNLSDLIREAGLSENLTSDPKASVRQRTSE